MSFVPEIARRQKGLRARLICAMGTGVCVLASESAFFPGTLSDAHEHKGLLLLIALSVSVLMGVMWAASRSIVDRWFSLRPGEITTLTDAWQYNINYFRAELREVEVSPVVRAFSGVVSTPFAIGILANVLHWTLFNKWPSLLESIATISVSLLACGFFGYVAIKGRVGLRRAASANSNRSHTE